MNTDIASFERLQQVPMKIGQWYVVAICIGILALDGYDVLSIAFAAPGITAEWGLSKAALGIVTFPRIGWNGIGFYCYGWFGR